MRHTIATISFLLIGLFPSILVAAIGLEVTSSANPQSDEAHSFIYFNNDQEIMQGIKINAQISILTKPIAFKFELREPLNNSHFIQWEIRTKDKSFGRFNIVSSFTGRYKSIKPGRLWISDKLSARIKNRHIFEFYPQPQEHQPSLYKKGRSKNNHRQKFGGGTKSLNDYIYNPRLSYQVSLVLYQGKTKIQTYTETIEQDDKDLLRQEYINHYGRKRYGRGKHGEINIPMRDELTLSPSNIKLFDGGTITSSEYKIMIEDGMLNLAQKVAHAFETTKQQIAQQKKPFVDLNNVPLPITKKQLWLSSGWRNPERNEWYSNAINGIHQRGAALDIIPNERPGSLLSAASYWLIWQSINNQDFNIPGYWQLESHGRQLKASEYLNDVSPKNGIPDAFDIADHLHIQLVEEAQ